MRNVVLGILMASALVFVGISTASAGPVTGNLSKPDSPTSLQQQVQYGGYCESLRRACLYKRELGEGGEGNCRRYRRECGGGHETRPRSEPRMGGTGGYDPPPRSEHRTGESGRCNYWQNRCASAYGWNTKSWFKCMKYGAPGC